jgi:hypothetical protein
MQRLGKVDERRDNRVRGLGVVIKERCNIPKAKF